MRRILAALIISFVAQPFAHAAPPEKVGAFATGKYRNLFAEAGHTPQQIDKKVNDAFRQLFHGDPKTQAIYFPDGKNDNGPLAYICDVSHDDVRSEGMSYGMMIAVQMNKKEEFNALWNWAVSHMRHDDPAHPAYGFFAWQCKTDGTALDEMPAADGEEYFVMSLYFAAARWPGGKGIYDYRAQADKLLADMLHRQSITGKTVTGEITAAEMFHPEHKMVRFTPDKKNSEHSDPSYHLPAFYELWALWGPPADRAFWKQAATASRDYFQKTAHPTTGLSPEYSEFDGSPWAAYWSKDSVHFLADAWRTAMNWSVDWAWWQADPREQELSDRIQAFFQSKDVSKYPNHYALDGKSRGGEHSTGLVGMNAVAGLAATQPVAKEFVEELWKAPIPSGKWRYYDGSLYMLAMLHCSGKFRVWTPK